MQIDGYNTLPSSLDVDSADPPSLHVDSVVTITTHSTLQIEGLAVPDSIQKVGVLQKVLEKSLRSILTKSSLCHPELSITLVSYDGKTFPKKRNKKSDKKRFLEAMQNREGKRQRRMTVLRTLNFGMVIPAKCNQACQNVSLHPGKLVFNQIAAHFQQYIVTGRVSSTLVTIGDAYDLFDKERVAPRVNSGTLVYHQGIMGSSMSWVPTFMPTTENPTARPQIETTLSPTVDICLAQKWNYKGDGKCTNR